MSAGDVGESPLFVMDYAMRLLRKSPIFASVATLSLALGLGVNATVFGLAYNVLLAPLALPKPERHPFQQHTMAEVNTNPAQLQHAHTLVAGRDVPSRCGC